MFDTLHSFVDFFGDQVDQGRRLTVVLLALPFIVALLLVSARAAWVERGEAAATFSQPEKPKTLPKPKPKAKGLGGAGGKDPKRSVWQFDPRTVQFLKAHGDDLFLVLFFFCALAVGKQLL